MKHSSLRDHSTSLLPPCIASATTNTGTPLSCLEVRPIVMGHCVPLCLQNTEEQAFEQLDLALAHGVNFIDTAELWVGSRDMEG